MSRLANAEFDHAAVFADSPCSILMSFERKELFS